MGVRDKIIHVGAHHGIAAGKDDDGPAHLGEGVDQRFGFLCGEFAGIGIRVRLGAAVLAGQIAGARHFPGDELAGGGAVFQRFGAAHGRMALAGIVRAQLPGGFVRVFRHQRTSPFSSSVSAK